MEIFFSDPIKFFSVLLVFIATLAALQATLVRFYRFTYDRPARGRRGISLATFFKRNLSSIILLFAATITVVTSFFYLRDLIKFDLISGGDQQQDTQLKMNWYL